MSKNTLQVLINGKQVGYASNLEIDMPSVRLRFQPTSSFAEFALLFESLDKAYDERRYEDVDQLSNRVDGLKISVRDERNRLVFSSDSSSNPVQRIAAVRFRGNELIWRPAS